MIVGKIYGVSATIAGAVASAAAVTPDPVVSAQHVAPLFVPYIGNVPIFAVAVGGLTSLLVKWVEAINNPKKLLGYNIAVTGIAMIGSVTYIIDHQISAGNSFWVGLSFGGAGFGVTRAAKLSIMQSIFAGIRDGFLKGLSPKATKAEPDDTE